VGGIRLNALVFGRCCGDVASNELISHQGGSCRETFYGELFARHDNIRFFAVELIKSSGVLL
jgi:hypothetical protein